MRTVRGAVRAGHDCGMPPAITRTIAGSIHRVIATVRAHQVTDPGASPAPASSADAPEGPAFEIDHAEASRVRVAAPTEGCALVITRYGAEKAVVLHPDDFRRLSGIMDLDTDTLTRAPSPWEHLTQLELVPRADEPAPQAPGADPETGTDPPERHEG